MLCFSSRERTSTTVGKIDSDGILWKSTQPKGEFIKYLDASMDTGYASLTVAAGKYADLPAVGSRPCRGARRVRRYGNNMVEAAGRAKQFD